MDFRSFGNVAQIFHLISHCYLCMYHIVTLRNYYNIVNYYGMKKEATGSASFFIP